MTVMQNTIQSDHTYILFMKKTYRFSLENASLNEKLTSNQLQVRGIQMAHEKNHD